MKQKVVFGSASAAWLGLCAIAFVLVPAGAAQAQQRNKVPRIGYLAASPPSASPARTEAFRQGLRELGYVEGQNILIEYRWAEGKVERLPNLASELVRLNVDVIVTAGPTAVPPAKEATATIPVVMTFDSNPVASGFVTSLARPGGNITGLTNLAQELSGKRLELLKDIFPKLSRVAILGISAIPGNAKASRETEQAAALFGLQTKYLDIPAAKDIQPAFRAVSKWAADAVSVLNGPPHIQRLIPDLAARARVAAMTSIRQSWTTGGL
jgi:putative ABC transport system substrate-binding protein